MNREAVFETLKVDEGVVYEIYKDHLGYPTFGVGHLVLDSDPEHGQEVGTPVSEDRVKECFEKKKQPLDSKVIKNIFFIFYSSASTLNQQHWRSMVCLNLSLWSCQESMRINWQLSDYWQQKLLKIIHQCLSSQKMQELRTRCNRQLHLNSDSHISRGTPTVWPPLLPSTVTIPPT